MKALILTVAALAVAGTVAAAPAAADTSGCVTRGEYRAVHKGDSMTRVHRIFDTAGKRFSIATSGGYGSQIRNYNTCSRWSSVAVSFSKNPGGIWRMDAKSAVWVS